MSHFHVYVVEGDVVEAVVPHMGESITDGTLANFLKSMLFFAYILFVSFRCMYVSNISIVGASNVVLAEPGDRVQADEPIAQIETDKVSNNYLIYYLRISFYFQ